MNNTYITKSLSCSDLFPRKVRSGATLCTKNHKKQLQAMHRSVRTWVSQHQRLMCWRPRDDGMVWLDASVSEKTVWPWEKNWPNRLAKCHWDSLRLIETHWDSLRLIDIFEKQDWDPELWLQHLSPQVLYGFWPTLIWSFLILEAWTCAETKGLISVQKPILVPKSFAQFAQSPSAWGLPHCPECGMGLGWFFGLQRFGFQDHVRTWVDLHSNCLLWRLNPHV